MDAERRRVTQNAPRLLQEKELPQWLLQAEAMAQERRDRKHDDEGPMQPRERKKVQYDQQVNLARTPARTLTISLTLTLTLTATRILSLTLTLALTQGTARAQQCPVRPAGEIAVLSLTLTLTLTLTGRAVRARLGPPYGVWLGSGGVHR